MCSSRSRFPDSLSPRKNSPAASSSKTALINPVTKYEVKGDRVRYYSAEREEWEELPSSLVDWPATEKYEKDRTAAPAIPEAALIDKETERRSCSRRGPASTSRSRPTPARTFRHVLLDNFKGQPQLVEVQQGEGVLDRNSKSNILRGAVASGKETIELDGSHAAVYSHVAVPSIYIKMDDDSIKPRRPEKPRPTSRLCPASTLPALNRSSRSSPNKLQPPTVSASCT